MTNQEDKKEDGEEYVLDTLGIRMVVNQDEN
jgi:hypothetical protein